MKLSSTAFPEGGPIPKQSSRKGGNLSPPLSWSSVPENTKSLAIVVDDPDAPDPAHPKCVWVHRVAYNIPPGSRALPTGASGTVKSFEEGLNDWKHTGYEGPQPPKGTHRYFHKLYALDTTLDLKNPTKAKLEEAMKGHIIEKTEYVGTFAAKSA